MNESGEKKLKHFNQGNVWGRVSSVKVDKSKRNKTPYLSITIECPNELYGNVKTYGRMYGQDKIEAFLDYHKKNPGSAYWFVGFFAQFTQDEKRLSNYTFFSWHPFNGSEFRAAFVLVGELSGTSIVEMDGMIALHLVRVGSGNYPDIEEAFEIYTLNAGEVNGLNEGDIIQASGILRPREPADYYGGATGDIKPYAMKHEVRREAKGPF